MKRCNACGKFKILDDFHRNKTKKDGYTSICKICRQEYDSKYYLDYYSDPVIRSHKQAYSRSRYLLVKHQKKEYKRNQRTINVQFKLSGNLRTRLLVALKNNYKSGSAVRDLGCSIEELKNYLESKFQPGMTWENWSRNGWHIDHIVPLDYFDLSNREQFLKACHYTNLQPLWAKDNIRKSNTI